MKFGSVCSGIEAASVAWHPLGWKAAWLSEIEPFPSAVLAHHYPDVPNLGDMTALPERILSGEVEAPDVFCGGTPCQAFSVAGLRNSLDDARGNLSLTFCEIANAIDTVRTGAGQQPAIIFWENVPGVLSTKDNAFGCFLAGLAGEDGELEPSGGKWTNAGVVYGPTRTVAWRVLDAQYFGVAQRRRRVFVVASARDDFDPAAVLFEFDGVRRDIAPSRQAREGVAGGIEIGPSGGRLTDLNPTLDTRAKDGPIRNQLAGAVMQPFAVANCLTARMHKGINSTLDEGQTPVITQAINQFGETAGTLTARHDSSADGTTHGLGCGSSGGQASVAVAIDLDQELNGRVELAGTLQRKGEGGFEGSVMTPAMAVRRLTPVECERLQGFPDNYTNIPWRKKEESPDGPRYKALGNSWAVPVVAWIGKRIQEAL
jgi:DNA (cytosine-5)-methyltransferase 1